jgi:C-terminal processing protease CtpA/Prc
MVTAPSEPPLSMKLDIRTAIKPLTTLNPHAFAFGLVIIPSLFAKNGRRYNVLLLGIVQLANIVIMYLLTKAKQWQARIAELEARSKQEYEEYENKLLDMKKQYQNDIDKINEEAEERLTEEINKLKHEYKVELAAEETTNEFEELKDMEERLEAQRQQLEQEKQDFLLEHLKKEKALEKKIEALETALLHW